MLGSSRLFIGGVVPGPDTIDGIGGIDNMLNAKHH